MNITATATFAEALGFPAGSSVSAYRFTVNTGGTGTHQDVAPGADVATFALTAPGDYVGTTQALDATGTPFGPIITSNTLTIAAPATISLSMPATMVLTETP
jgi:hypothetical protein